MARIDLNNLYPGISYPVGSVGAARAAEQIRVQERQAPQEAAQEQAPASAAAAQITPVERGNQAPQEAAQLIRPFNSSIPDFTANDTVHTPDMAKAISDMQKDDVLHEYQYFVGSANGTTGAGASDIAYQDEDGLVRRIS